MSFDISCNIGGPGICEQMRNVTRIENIVKPNFIPWFYRMIKNVLFISSFGYIFSNETEEFSINAKKNCDRKQSFYESDRCTK